MKGKKILLVDDEVRLLESCATLLGDHFRVVTAPDAMEALERLGSEHIDCIVLDIVMPLMNGLEFLKVIRTSGHKVPVIIVTGNSCLQYAEQCADLNVSGYINKPYKIDDLVKRLKNVLDPAFIPSGDMDDNDFAGLSSRLKEALEYINLNYQRHLTLRTIARDLCASSDYIGKLFKNDMGLSFSGYINGLRVEKAKSMIIEGSLSISDIAARAGFGSQQNFFKQFKRHTGVTPSEYRFKKTSKGG
ncbi:MAG: response regulator [bacterium]|nr:response regulator [bacterium]